MRYNTATLLVSLLFLSSSAFAQDTLVYASAGLKTGVPQTTLLGEGGEGLNYRTHSDGFFSMVAFGAYVELRPFGARYLTVQPELLYMPKGTGIVIGNGSREAKAELSLNYLEVPVLLKVDLPVGRRFSPALYAGPYVGFTTHTHLDVQSGNPILEETAERLDRFRGEGTDFGAALGGSFDVKLFGNAFSFDVRYDLGLKSIVDGSEGRIRTGAFAIMLEQSF